MKRMTALLLVVGLLALAGCARSSDDESPPPSAARPVELGQFSASAGGLDLAIVIRQAEPGLHDVSVSIAAPGSDPVEVKTPDGSIASVEIKNASGEVAFNSRQLDREALESNPSVTPDESQSLADGGSEETTYRIALKPGRYTLLAQTFDPVAIVPATEFIVQ